MPLRHPAPDPSMLLSHMLADDYAQFMRVHQAPPFDDSRYFHWSELIRRTPPEGFSHEEWWFGLKQQRKAQMRPTALRAKDGTVFTVALTDEVLQLSDEIARRAGGSVSTGDTEAAQHNGLTRQGRDRYILRSLTEEAITSSQLEGASTTRRVAQAMIDSGRAPIDTSEKMIFNNYLAMQGVLERAAQPLTPEMVKELHITVTQGTLEDPQQAGRLERPGDERVSVWANDMCVHVPPPASELPERLAELCEFANGTAQDTPYLPPVVRAIITHFMFGYDHYFADGNGRTARIAFYWAMLHNDYWLAEYLSISKILKKAHGKYGDSYEYTEDDEGDLTYFVRHQLRTIKKALDKLDDYIEMKRAEERKVQDAVRRVTVRFTTRQARLLKWIAEGSWAEGSVHASGLGQNGQGELGISVPQLARRFRVSEPTARNDLAALEHSGLLQRGVSKRPVTWTPVDDFAQRIREMGLGDWV